MLSIVHWTNYALSLFGFITIWEFYEHGNLLYSEERLETKLFAMFIMVIIMTAGDWYLGVDRSK